MQDINGMIMGLIDTAKWIEGAPGTGRTHRRDMVVPIKRRLLTDELLAEFLRRLTEMDVKFAVTKIEGEGGMVYVDMDSMLTERRGRKVDEL